MNKIKLAFNLVAGDGPFTETHATPVLSPGFSRLLKYGTLSVDAQGHLIYTQDDALVRSFGAKYVGNDSVTLIDAIGQTYLLSIKIKGVNDGPVAVNDSASYINGVLTVSPTPKLLANDSDPDRGDRIDIKDVEGVQLTKKGYVVKTDHGQLTVSKNGSYVFKVDADQKGKAFIDTVHYTIKDSHGATATATLTLTNNGGIPPAPPAAPEITAVTIAPYSGEGSAGTSTLTLKLTGAAGGAVKVYNGESLLGTATAVSPGTYQLTKVLLPTSGEMTLSATVTAVGGVTSGSSNSVTVDRSFDSGGGTYHNTVSAADQAVKITTDISSVAAQDINVHAHSADITVGAANSDISVDGGNAEDALKAADTVTVAAVIPVPDALVPATQPASGNYTIDIAGQHVTVSAGNGAITDVHGEPEVSTGGSGSFTYTETVSSTTRTYGGSTVSVNAGSSEVDAAKTSSSSSHGGVITLVQTGGHTDTTNASANASVTLGDGSHVVGVVGADVTIDLGDALQTVVTTTDNIDYDSELLTDQTSTTTETTLGGSLAEVSGQQTTGYATTNTSSSDGSSGSQTVTTTTVAAATRASVSLGDGEHTVHVLAAGATVVVGDGGSALTVTGGQQDILTSGSSISGSGTYTIAAADSASVGAGSGDHHISVSALAATVAVGAGNASISVDGGSAGSSAPPCVTNDDSILPAFDHQTQSAGAADTVSVTAASLVGDALVPASGNYDIDISGKQVTVSAGSGATVIQSESESTSGGGSGLSAYTQTTDTITRSHGGSTVAVDGGYAAPVTTSESSSSTQSGVTTVASTTTTTSAVQAAVAAGVSLGDGIHHVSVVGAAVTITAGDAVRSDTVTTVSTDYTNPSVPDQTSTTTQITEMGGSLIEVSGPQTTVDASTETATIPGDGSVTREVVTTTVGTADTASVTLGDGDHHVRVLAMDATVGTGDGDDRITVSGQAQDILTSGSGISGSGTYTLDAADSADVTAGSGDHRISVSALDATVTVGAGDSRITIDGGNAGLSAVACNPDENSTLPAFDHQVRSTGAANTVLVTASVAGDGEPVPASGNYSITVSGEQVTVSAGSGAIKERTEESTSGGGSGLSAYTQTTDTTLRSYGGSTVTVDGGRSGDMVDHETSSSTQSGATTVVATTTTTSTVSAAADVGVTLGTGSHKVSVTGDEVTVTAGDAVRSEVETTVTTDFTSPLVPDQTSTTLETTETGGSRVEISGEQTSTTVSTTTSVSSGDDPVTTETLTTTVAAASEATVTLGDGDHDVQVSALDATVTLGDNPNSDPEGGVSVDGGYSSILDQDTGNGSYLELAANSATVTAGAGIHSIGISAHDATVNVGAGLDSVSTSIRVDGGYAGALAGGHSLMPDHVFAADTVTVNAAVAPEDRMLSADAPTGNYNIFIAGNAVSVKIGDAHVDTQDNPDNSFVGDGPVHVIPDDGSSSYTRTRTDVLHSEGGSAITVDGGQTRAVSTKSSSDGFGNVTVTETQTTTWLASQATGASGGSSTPDVDLSLGDGSHRLTVFGDDVRISAGDAAGLTRVQTETRVFDNAATPPQTRTETYTLPTDESGGFTYGGSTVTVRGQIVFAFDTATTTNDSDPLPVTTTSYLIDRTINAASQASVTLGNGEHHVQISALSADVVLGDSLGQDGASGSFALNSSILIDGGTHELHDTAANGGSGGTDYTVFAANEATVRAGDGNHLIVMSADDATIAVGAGDNTISVDGGRDTSMLSDATTVHDASSVSVTTGNGAQNIEINATQATVVTGTGNDSIGVTALSGVTLDVKAGLGSNLITVNADHATVTVDDGVLLAGVNTITVTTTGTGSGSADHVTAGSGNDAITVDAKAYVNVDAGTGSNTVTVTADHADITVGDAVGSGGSTITLTSLDAASGSTDSVTAGAGNDTITVDAKAYVDVDAGKGNNTVTVTADHADITVGDAVGSGGSTITLTTLDAASGSTDSVTAGSGNDNITVTANGAVTVLAGAGNDTISIVSALSSMVTGGAGNDTVHGGTGIHDTVVFSGAQSDYTFTDNGDGTYSVADTRADTPDGTDTLDGNIETLHFSGGDVALIGAGASTGWYAT